jgi:hypothetical protein
MSLNADAALINDGKVDSRLERSKVTHPTLPLERTFCAFCGQPKGWVSQDSGDFIAAQNVVVVCDRCNEKFASKLGPLPGEAPIQEFQLRDAEIGVDQAFLDSLGNNSSEWVENCIDCHIPMVKLQPMPPEKAVPLMDTLRVGGCTMDKNRLLGVEKSKATATPQWFCRKCRTLWGPIDQFWCKFRKV